MGDEGDRRAKIESVFNEAVSIALSKRDDFLDEKCAGDSDLRREVESMLARHEGMTADFLESPPGGGQVGEVLDAAHAGERAQIGPYKILETLGEGGFGVVYLAEQTAPVRRRVALKVIKPGMDSKAVLARFEAERQALAMMDHPSIAKVFDAGSTERGLPYIAMEHVKGVPITDHCDQHRLTMPERLELFMKVCDAIQHAHQKGVIHRDLKPSNILVEYENDVATPKVIDFGVAKALNQKLTEKTIFTEQGQLIGTPEYMSPEQAEMTAQDIDTRSDVYSLGVLLYEVLSGRLPFEPDELRAAGYAEIQRIIREVDPPKPSTRLQTMLSTKDASEQATKIARARQVPPRDLPRRVRGDLDWIVMHCLEKDRARRYATANGLREDIGRFLHSEPVSAGPPSGLYRAKKFVRRNRGPVLAASAVVVAMIIGIITTTWQAIVAERARRVAEARLATGETLVTTLTENVLESVSRLRGATGPRNDLIEAVVTYLDAMSEDPEAADALRRLRVDAYQALGQVRGGSEVGNLGNTEGALAAYDVAQQMAEQLHAADSSVENAMLVVKAKELRAQILRRMGENETASILEEEALATLESLAADHAESDEVMLLYASALRGLASRLAETDASESDTQFVAAAEICERLIAANRSASDAQKSLSATLRERAHLASRRGEAGAAAELYERSFEIRARLAAAEPDDAVNALEFAKSMYYLADARIYSGRYEDALQLLERARVIADDLYRADASVRAARSEINNVESLRWLSVLVDRRAEILKWDLGDMDRAIPMYREYARIATEIASSDLSNMEKRFYEGEAWMRLGEALGDMGDASGAVENAERGRAILKDVVDDSPERVDWALPLAWTYAVLCREYRNLDRLIASRDAGERAVAMYESAGGDDLEDVYDRMDFSESLMELATTLGQAGQIDAGMAMLERSEQVVNSIPVSADGVDLSEDKSELLGWISERRALLQGG